MTITTYYLQMQSEKAHVKADAISHMTVVEAQIKQYQLNALMYAWVGSEYDWRDKSNWSEATWRADVEHDGCRTWVAYVKGSIAGYFELLKHEQEVQIRYFGLTPAFVGRGMGSYLLSQAIEQAWLWQPVNRVWLHTCSKDHAHALPNYLARGFSVYQQQVQD